MEQNDKYLRGLRSLSQYLKIGIVTCQRLKNKGVFDGCYFQDRRTLIFDRELIQKKLFGGKI